MPRMNLGLPFGQCNSPDCLNRTQLLKCGACKAVMYCGAEHQRGDWPRHRSSCNIIKGASAKYNQEETALRTHQLDPSNPSEMSENPLENAVGDFWTLPGTRPYMQARFDLMTALLNIRTGEAVEAALAHALEMLRLCHGDNLGVRGQVAALYLRLGRDQEAYDFIKWWGVKADSKYDYHNMSLPYLDLHGEDAMESSFGEWWLPSLSMKVALTLIKLRLLLDLEMLQKAVRKIGGTMSNEQKMACLQSEALSDILLSRPDIVNQENYDGAVALLSQQVDQAYQLVKGANKYFWSAILRPEGYSHSTPSTYSAGSEAETVLAFRESWYSWAETESAITAIREKIRRDK